MQGIYEIDLTAQPPHEATALALTLLTYPQSGEPDTQLDQRFGEISAYIIRRRSEADANWANDLQPMRPSHLLMSGSRIATAGNKLGTLLGHCLEAGEMAIPFIDDVLLGAAASLPPGVTKLTQNQIAEYVAGYEAKANVSNIKTRGFRANLPVIHMCAAFAWLHRLMAHHSDYPAWADGMIGDMDLLRIFVLMAEGFEGPVLNSEHIPVDSEQLVRLRWIDNQVQKEVAA